MGLLQLNYRDATPIYEQIKDGMCRLILTEVLKPEEQLPSVRDMASRLAINPNTIQRAYRELETEGYIYTVPGKGSFAAEQSDVNGRRNEALRKEFDEIVRELLYLSGDKEALIRRIEEIAGGGEKQ